MTSASSTGTSRLPRLGVSLPLAFFTCFFIGNAVLGYFAIMEVSGNQEAVGQSRRNINLISQLQIDVLRAESGQRGYLLTDLESYALPYRVAVQTINESLIALNNTPFDPVQLNRASELQQLVVAKMLELEEAVNAVRDDRPSEAIQLLFTHQGRGLMERLSGLAGEMDAYERAALDLRQAQAEESRATAFYLILTANIVGLVMVFISMNMVRISQRKERGLLESLQEANDNLEARVEERTEALRHYSLELKRSNRELQDFAFVASHDLQEPLRKIRAFGDRLAQEDHGMTTQAQDYVRRMQNASQRMSSLIEDLLSFSRITTKAKPFLPVDLNEVVNEVLDDLEMAINEANARIDVDAMPVVDADRFQMKQLMQNLVGNALKFRKPDDRTYIRIESEPDTEANQVVLRVIDNGIGFDQAYAERIFMPFQRLHGRDQYPGTGIGLAICRRIVERHQGSIVAISAADQGSTFKVTLPMEQDTPSLEEPM